MANYTKGKLSTNPNVEVTVPVDYDIKAKNLIESIMNLSSYGEFVEKLPELFDEHDCLANHGIVNAAKRLAENKDTPHTQVCTDKLYLRIAIKGNEIHLNSPIDENEYNEALRVDQELIGKIDELDG